MGVLYHTMACHEKKKITPLTYPMNSGRIIVSWPSAILPLLSP